MLKKTILAASLFFIAFFAVAIAKAGPFPDTEGSDYAVAVEFLYERGVVGGYPDGSFRYWQTVNRAELLKIILESKFDSIPETPNTNCGFGDVQPNEWYTKYVCFAKNQGIVQGYPDGSFQPSRPVNFVEALKITGKSYGWEVNEPSDEWFRDYVQEAGGYRIPNVVSFDQLLTRGEMADMITRFIKNEEGGLWDYLDRENFGYITLHNYECLKNGTCPIMMDIPASRSREKLLNNAMTKDQELEYITFVVNQDVVDRSPNWQTNARNLINVYNDILKVNTNKQLEIGKFEILDKFSDICELHKKPDKYFLENEGYGGLTVVYTIGGESLSCSIYINGTVGEVDGQNFGIVYMIGASDDPEVPSVEILPALIHEMGHAYGLGKPEWYSYFNLSDPRLDETGSSPNLGVYIPHFMNGNLNEPMINASLTPYSELNAFILNHNGNHRFNVQEIADILPDNVMVRVRDSAGNPINNATVEVYGIENNALQKVGTEPQPLLETTFTDAQGEASISKTSKTQVFYADSNIEYLVKAVKVSKNGKTAGAYYSTLDLQYATMIEGKDVYEITLELK